MSPSRIFPNWEQIEKLRTPLTEGEKILVEYLDQNLPEEWEIYVQPFFNGDHPDIVILHPKVGMVFYEVKDWKGNSYSSQLVNKEQSFVGGESKSIYLEFYVTTKDKKVPIPNPVNQVNRYRKKLLGLYQPEIGEAVDQNNRILLAFRTAVFFPFLDQEQIDELFKDHDGYTTIFGRDKLEKENISLISPDANLTSSLYMQEEWEKYLRFWLMPSFHALEQGENIKLNDEQRRHVSPSPGKHQRLRGVVGSGKTLVIAMRAANLAAEGKRVLIVTFNITLWHYIRDMIARAPAEFDWGLIEFTHFHGFCRDYLDENDILFPFDESISDEEFLGKVLPKAVLDEKNGGSNANNRLYDAILIDEGQDFDANWYDTLCAFLSDNDELLLVIDERQNIYDRDLSWLNKMTGSKFRGPWRELSNSYRLPREFIEKINIFVNQFMAGQGENLIPEIYQPTLIEPKLIWRNIDINTPLIEVWDMVYKTVSFLTTKKEIHPQDIAILVPSHNEGWDLVEFLKDKRFNVNHVFEDEEHPHFNKKTFWMNDGRIKASTVHSFKGWEIMNLIVVTPPFENPQNNGYDKTLYTALTRMRENLIVINRSKRYEEFGRLWPDNWKSN